MAISDLLARKRATPQRVVVEVSDAPVVATVVRAGREVPAAAISARAEGLLGLKERPRQVVLQSIAPGTIVAKGTVIDLVMAPASNIRVGIFDVFHAGLADRTLAQLADSDALADIRLAEILTRRPDPREATDEERAVVTEALRGLGAPVDPADPNRSYEAGHQTLRNALAFRL